MTTQSQARRHPRRAHAGDDPTRYAVQPRAPVGPHPPTAEHVVSSYLVAIEQELAQ